MEYMLTFHILNVYVDKTQPRQFKFTFKFTLQDYISVVRPVLEYACPVWHTNLPKYLSDSIELIQNRALKSIFPGMSYNDILNDTGLRTLKERRNVLCMKYVAGIQGSAHKLNGLLPALRKVDYDLRPGFNRYPLTRYRTNRYGNSLIPWGLSHWQ